MLSMLYFLVFAISVIALILLIMNYKNTVSCYYPLLFVALTVTNFGFMQLSSATTLETAIFANQTSYLGACFSPFFLVMCIADLCKIKVKSGYQTIFGIYAVINFIMVSTIGISSWYYKSVSLDSAYGVTILVKEYGPIHIIYPFYLLAMCVVALVIIIKAIMSNKDVSYTTGLMLLGCMMVVVFVYVIERVLHLKLDYVPFSYLVAEAGCLYLVRRVSKYELSAISAKTMLEGYNYGFVLYSNKGKYLGSDETAKIWFPELRELRVDGDIKTEGSPLFEQIGKWIHDDDDDCNGEVAYIEKSEDMIIEVTHSILRQKKSDTINCLYLEDETKQQQYTKLVKRYNEDLERNVEMKTQKLRKVQNDIIISMASIVENRDSNTGGHIARTSDIVNIFVEYLLKNYRFKELTPEMAARITKAAPLHDFGKIGIPDVILNKPGKFTEEEYEIMKQHSAKGAVIVEQILRHSDDEEFKAVAINIAHYHHEKWDGKGYPEGISGTDIPFEARVMALADVFDALVSKRVYKDSFSYDRAFEIIEESLGNHFDPDLCAAFLECRPQLEKLYDGYVDR